eukprot:scaffold4859_cov128-Isochrysis_galbana.AAC.3
MASATPSHAPGHPVDTRRADTSRCVMTRTKPPLPTSRSTTRRPGRRRGAPGETEGHWPRRTAE